MHLQTALLRQVHGEEYWLLALDRTVVLRSIELVRGAYQLAEFQFVIGQVPSEAGGGYDARLTDRYNGAPAGFQVRLDRFRTTQHTGQRIANVD